MGTTTRKQMPLAASRGTAPLVLQVTPHAPTAPLAEIELQPLFYRGVTYMMPASVVRAPLPTFTFRHLEKVGTFALEGNRAKVLTSLQRAVASAIDAPSLIKIAAVAHSEGCPDEARASLAKALKVSARHPDMQALVHAGAKALGYEVS
ncbi:hypothetical protein J7643_13800 [bacterium]|nr:hypothetical protein [bacterium]